MRAQSWQHNNQAVTTTAKNPQIAGSTEAKHSQQQQKNRSPV